MFDYVIYLVFECLVSVMSSICCLNVWLVAWHKFVSIRLHEEVLVVVLWLMNVSWLLILTWLLDLVMVDFKLIDMLSLSLKHVINMCGQLWGTCLVLAWKGNSWFVCITNRWFLIIARFVKGIGVPWEMTRMCSATRKRA